MGTLNFQNALKKIIDLEDEVVEQSTDNEITSREPCLLQDAPLAEAIGIPEVKIEDAPTHGLS
jgi:hypothetical protein